MSLSTQIRRVAIKDYKSIAHCDVNLGPLTFLVGPNGSGKSNFLDALGFVADALRYSLDHAVRARGGIREILRRSPDRPDRFALSLDVDLNVRPEVAPEGNFRFAYTLEVGVGSSIAYQVVSEECRWWSEPATVTGYFRVEDGTLVDTSISSGPNASKDRLYLVTASGLYPLGLLYRALWPLSIYIFRPTQMREYQSPGPGDLLNQDGSNLPDVLSKLVTLDSERGTRVVDFLKLVVPSIANVQRVEFGPKVTLKFTEQRGDASEPREFYAASMSDGTLRALATLVAAYQTPPEPFVWPAIGIEEPEIALHPGAAEVLLDILREASLSRQVLVTTHSTDLLDRKDIPVESILAVSADGSDTRIAPVDKAGREMLARRLWTVGELMRINQLTPESEHPSSQPQTRSNAIP